MKDKKKKKQIAPNLPFKNFRVGLVIHLHWIPIIHKECGVALSKFQSFDICCSQCCLKQKEYILL